MERCLFCDDTNQIVQHRVIIIKVMGKINIPVEPSLTVFLCKDCQTALLASRNEDEFMTNLTIEKKKIAKHNFKMAREQIEWAIKVSAWLLMKNPELCGRNYNDVISYYPYDTELPPDIENLPMNNNIIFGAYAPNYKDYGITDMITGLKHNTEREIIKYIKERTCGYISTSGVRVSEHTLKKYINERRAKKKYNNKFSQRIIETAIQELVDEGVIEEEIKEKYIKSKSKMRRIKIKMYKLA